MKTTLISALLTVLPTLTSAATPGCLLAAVNTQNEPGDLSAVCGSGAQVVQSYIANNCGGFEQAAQMAFVDTCSSAGTSVAPYTAASLSISNTLSYTSTSTSTTHSTTTMQASMSESVSPSSASTASTAGANSNHKQIAMGSAAAAAIVLIGAAAAL